MYNKFIRLYKNVPLNISLVMTILVNWLIENRKKILGRTLSAVLVACLLGAIVYYSPIGNVSSKPSFAFALLVGDQTQMDPEYANTSLLWRFFEMQFGLGNGSRIYAGGVGLHVPKGESWGGVKPEYHGGFNASVQDIVVNLWSYRRNPPGTFENQTAAPIRVGSIANVSTIENATIHASFVTPMMTYMDNCTFIYGPEGSSTSSCGYWNLDPVWGRVNTNCPWWEISSGELLRYLEGSGTTTITFDATYNVHVNYSVKLGGETEIGEKDLHWEGTLGTIEIKYDENGIFEIRYDFIRIEFVLLTLLEETNP